MLHVDCCDTGCMMVFVKVLSHVLYSLSQSIFRVPHGYHIDVVPGIPDVDWDFVKSTTSLVPKRYRK